MAKFDLKSFAPKKAADVGIPRSILLFGPPKRGKSTCAASIVDVPGYERVLVIDGDIGLRNLDVIMGLENRIVFNVVDVIKGVCKPQQALIKSKKSNNLFPDVTRREKTDGGKNYCYGIAKRKIFY